MGGGIVGIDRALDENTHYGIAGGYTMTDLHIKNAANAKADINSARFNLYGAHAFEYLTLSGIGGYAYHDVAANRNLLGIGTAKGKQGQNETSLNFQLTMNPNAEGHSLLPYCWLRWRHQRPTPTEHRLVHELQHRSGRSRHDPKRSWRPRLSLLTIQG